MKISSIINYLISFLELQFFVSLVSLPILILWGLPISVMTPIGNLIFTPILTLFLFISTIIFLTEIIGIPNHIFIFALEKISDVWIYSIHLSSNKWLISFKIQYLLLLIIPIIYLASRIIGSSFSPKVKVCTLFLLILSTFSLLSIKINNNKHTIFSPRGKLTIKIVNKKLILKDKGALSCGNVISWIDYTLLSELSKNYGSRSINKIIMTRLNKTQIDAILHLKEICQIEEVDSSRVTKNALYNEFIEKLEVKS